MTIVEPVTTKTKNQQKSLRIAKLVPLLVVTAGAIIVVVLTYTLPPFRNYQLATIGAYLCVTAGLTVLTGLNGQLSLGHGALMATGAYTLALWQNKVNLLLLGIGYRTNGAASIFVDIPPNTKAVDPVVKALTLTDVVVGAAVTALLLALAVQAQKRFGTLDPDELDPLRD